MRAAEPIVGVLLAGGLSRRMGGGDKSLRLLGGESLLDRIIRRAGGQVDALILNANGDPARFGARNLPVVADGVPGFPGPLAGVLAGMEWTAANRPEARWLASFATDAPFLPLDLVDRLRDVALRAGTPLACAASAGQVHPVFGLWSIDLRADLRRALVDEQLYKVDRWTARHGVVEVEFPTLPVDPFFNANRPEDLLEAERLLGAAGCLGAG
ncbi:MAG TPA: molybdenum cofactor guanylyltransferase MobA [Stellaceae bacterium]|nr:molybdenum cofactor guanylyltransferase MobA [Stellaceae bacterium]